VAAPRAVTGTVEVRLGDQVRRYAVRVQRHPNGFVPVLRALGPRGRPPPHLGTLPYVRERPRPDAPVVIETPQGTVAARFAYVPLGPWEVLDRAVTAIRLRTPSGERTVAFEVTLREPRLER
jgi:hypothetical protein